MPQQQPGFSPNFYDAIGLRGSASKSHAYAQFYGGVRMPFVRLKFQGQEIPLIDNAKQNAKGTEAVENPLFLVDMVHTIEATMAGSNSLMIRIFDPGYTYLEDILVKRASEIQFNGFSIHYGWKGVDDAWSGGRDTVPLYVLNTEFDVDPFRGAIVTLHCVDQSHDLFVGSHYDSWPETDTIDQVIGKVLSKYHPRLDYSITPMKTQVGNLRHMEGQSAGSYIADLLEHAAPRDGSQPVFTVRVGHPRNAKGRSLLEIGAGTIRKPVETYTFGRERQGEMLSFRAVVNDRAQLLLAGGRTTVSATDPESKTQFNEEHSLKDDNATSGPKRSITTPTMPTDNTPSPVDAEKATNANNGQRALVDSVMWEGNATLMGDTKLQPYDTIYVGILTNPPTGSEVTNATANNLHRMTSGIWTILSVTNQIEAGTFITRLELFRSGGFRGVGSDGTPSPLAFSTVKKIGGKGVWSRVQPLDNPGANETGNVWC